MAVIEFRNGSGFEKRQPMQFGERIRDVIFLPVHLTNPVHWRDSTDLRVAVVRSSDDERLSMKIRDAVPDDASAACEVMRRCITELCIADHDNDPVVLGRWLNNKTLEIFRSWIRPGNSVLVATDIDDILAVGCVTNDGEITLNYVSPDARFRGVSTALLVALERRAIEHGSEICRLESTETARRFYRDRGYSEEGPADRKFGTASGYPMSKRLK
jgi:GNAT superfamily N-acetyltransferase